MKIIAGKSKQIQQDQAREKAEQALLNSYGMLKGKVKPMTDEEWYAWRFKYGEELYKEWKKKYGWND